MMMTGKPSIDKPWLKHYPKGVNETKLPQATIYEYLYSKNKECLNDIALEYFGRKISYSELFKNIERVAKAFKTASVEKGDIVAVSMPNTPEMVYILYALNKIGAVANMINPLFANEQITQHLNNTDCKLAIVLDLIYDKIKTAISQSNVEKTVVVSPKISLPPVLKILSTLKRKNISVPYNDKNIAWKDFVAKGKDYVGSLQTEYKKDTPAVMVYSSGSTGASKGIVLTNDSFNALTFMHEVENIFIKRNQRCLSIIPSFFSTGISPSLNMPLCLGVTVIQEPNFSKEAFVKQIKKSKPNHAIAATSLWEALLTTNTLKGTDLSFLMLIVAGGEALPESVENAINAFLKDHNAHAEMSVGWGMCEFGASVTTSAMDNIKTKGTGIPLSHIAVSVFDTETDEELTYNQRGELRVISPACMLGYYKNPEATEAFFRKGKDGQIWGHSGDVGYIDENGVVYVEGRANDNMIAPDGTKIYHFDTEKILLEDEAVELCEILGMNIVGREIPLAHIVLKGKYKGQEAIVIKRLDKKCKKKLNKYAVPQGYKIRTSFEANSSGKRNVEALKTERDGFCVVDGEKLREVSFEK
jgi:long-chain acyl-CoA synthetase